MKKTIKVMTEEEIQQRADELTIKVEAKVTPFVFTGDSEDDQVIGYFKEPKRDVKIKILDKAQAGIASAAEDLMNLCVIKEASDARIYSDLPENDTYYMGAVMEVQNLLKFSVNVLKKK
ncbi:hypothetical protein ACE38W_14990 [Chitinophaga sp. Hz27]|uniref:hypothetical protein n=1 Tax=Chitinophaga sp. Hz27 TaxID=3347169 RepID=UPI0035D68960